MCMINLKLSHTKAIYNIVYTVQVTIYTTNIDNII